MKSEALAIRPYARLLTMLGDQLIKNERIALVELIKNSYDADADRGPGRFEDFHDDMTHDDASRIVISDDGAGMSLDTVRTRWMNPAAPQKYVDKQQGRGSTPGKKRVIQGEKGIGRFAVLKLGRVITVTTRQPRAEFETVLRTTSPVSTTTSCRNTAGRRRSFWTRSPSTACRQRPRGCRTRNTAP